MADFTMTIDGQAAPTAGTFDVLNPATNERYAAAPECSPEQLDAAMESAAKAYRDWKADEPARREALRQAAGALMAASGELAPILVAGSGTLVGTLLEHDLVDELRLMVFPTILGRGKRLFPDGIDRRKLRLVEARMVGPDGVQVHTYRRA